ncbi:MAG: hypothetical protein K2X03_06805 [Bryobacteraceae bacterium]|nr:hypothetical protein [Bryobacteraceae bacterium]
MAPARLHAVSKTLFLLLFASALMFAATFGTVVPLVGGATDIVLDASRNRLYLVGVPDTLQIYSIPERRFLASIRTDALALSLAMTRDNRFLYIACHNSSSLNVVDLNTLQIIRRISLPARPEGLAIGNDNRVLISTIGTGANNAQNILLLYDPAAEASGQAISAIPVTPPPPTPPVLPAPSGRTFQANRSQLLASNDGRFIVGVNLPNATTRAVFVYEVASNTVLRSRSLTGASSVLAIAPDNSRFMAGLTLFDLQTLEVLAQQNLANAPYPIPSNTNFNTQVNQGGSVFTSDSQTLYSAFNVAPVQNPPARANIAQLMYSDPDNLLIRGALQTPENLAGKMVMSADNANLYALSESGFVIFPLSTLNQSVLLTPTRTAVLLANDQCGVVANQRTARVTLRNDGRGPIGPVTTQLLDATNTPSGLGGVGGIGGGVIGGAGGGGAIPGIPGVPGGGVIINIPGFPGIPGAGGAAGGQQNNAANAFANSAPAVRPVAGAESALDFTITTATRNIGTVTPTHNFLLQAPQAVNLPPRVTVYQNNRNSEARGDIMPIETGISAAEGLVDLVMDTPRQRVYIANSGLNRVEIYDIRTRTMLPPIKVGQLPRALALALDGTLLYVANSGGESITVVDLDRRTTVGRIKFPPIPFNSNAVLITPQALVATQRGLMVIMNNGTIWRAVGDELVPRDLSPIIGTATIPAPRTMTSTPNGEYALLLAGNGNAYLYDAVADQFVQSRTLFTGTSLNSGFYGPVAAGPRGQYFLVNNTVLNQSLTPLFSAQSSTAAPGQRPGQPTVFTNTPIPAVTPLGATSFLRVTLGTTATTSTGVASLEMVDTNTGNTMRRLEMLEGPAVVVNNQRQNIVARTMAVDATGTNAYVITASGLSIVPLDQTVPAADRPAPNQNGTVSMASYLPPVAQGGLISIFGRNLAENASADTSRALPTTLGGLCVTLNNTPIPLIMTSSGQINAQVPPEFAAGRFPLLVRNINKKAAALLATQLTVAKYAPAVFVQAENKQAAIYHENGQPVTPANPTTRDKRVTIYATGLGLTKGTRVIGGTPSPAGTTTDKVEVFFGDPRFSQSDVVVESSRLLPGAIGVYEIKVYVPGDRMRGSALPVTLKIGGVSSPVNGPLPPTVAVE